MDESTQATELTCAALAARGPVVLVGDRAADMLERGCTTRRLGTGSSSVWWPLGLSRGCWRCSMPPCCSASSPQFYGGQLSSAHALHASEALPLSVGRSRWWRTSPDGTAAASRRQVLLAAQPMHFIDAEGHGAVLGQQLAERARGGGGGTVVRASAPCASDDVGVATFYSGQLALRRPSASRW